MFSFESGLRLTLISQPPPPTPPALLSMVGTGGQGVLPTARETEVGRVGCRKCNVRKAGHFQLFALVP